MREDPFIAGAPVVFSGGSFCDTGRSFGCSATAAWHGYILYDEPESRCRDYSSADDSKTGPRLVEPVPLCVFSLAPFTFVLADSAIPFYDARLLYVWEELLRKLRSIGFQA